MKTLLLLISLTTFANNSNNIGLKHKTSLNYKPSFFYIPTFYEIGIKRRDCAGWGLSCLFEIVTYDILKKNDPQHLEITLLDSKNLSFTFYAAANELEKDFLVEDISKNLFQKHAQRFGCSFLELLPGTYRTTKLSDGRINVVLKINSR